MVKHVDDNGYIYVDPLGGIDEIGIAGSEVVILGAKERVRGIFGKKATHEQSTQERETTPKLQNLWIEAGFRSKDEALERVEIGDYVTFALDIIDMRNDRIVAPGLDDKAGLFAILETLRRCSERELNAALWVVSSVQEEVGLRGATTATFAVRPDVGIAVDVTNASDDPGNDKKTTVPCLLGDGPCISHGPNTNAEVEKLLLKVAREHKIRHQRLPQADLEGNDAKAIQVSGAGVAVASVSIPNRNMHTQREVCHLLDIEDTARLLTEYVCAVTEKTDFCPLHIDPSRRGHGPMHNSDSKQI